MYETILNLIFQARGLEDEDDQAAFLSGLKAPARRLWNAYQSNSISIDYSNENYQLAYMLRYFPFYSQVIRQILNMRAENDQALPFGHNNVVVSLFCSGPVPEAYGISQFLNDYYPDTESLEINTFDLHVEGWTDPRNITVENLIPEVLPDCELEVVTHEFDLRQPFDEELNETIERSDLIVFQNCLNEISTAKRPRVKRTMSAIMSNMSPNSLLVLIERAGYDEIKELLREIAELAPEHNCTRLTRLMVVERTFSFSDIKNSVPQIIWDNLFDYSTPVPNGLIMSPQVKCYYTVIRKNEDEITDD